MLNPQRNSLRRSGTLIPILALTVTLLLAFIALAVDVGILTIARTDAQNSCDSAALAGARVLNNRPTASANDRTAAINHARAIAKSNINVYVNQKTKYTDSNLTGSDPVQIGVYTYNTTTQRFDVSFPGSLPANQSWTACRVKLNGNHSTFFAKVVGINTMPWETYATAVHRPRDIAFVVDFSGSMGWGSTANWPYDGNGTGTVEGSMNPDPAYPKFGHYSRYTFNQHTSPSGQTSTTPTSRPNPFRMIGASGDYPPNNFTMETGGGPAMIDGYLTAPGDPSSVSASTAFTNAFKMWNPVLVTPANTTTLAPPVYNFGSYNVATAAVPAPDNFDTQSDTPIAYVGDKWPRTDGSRSGSSAWSTLSGSTYTDTGVYTLQQYLNSTLTGTAGRALSNITLPGGGSATALQTNAADGGNAMNNYLDTVWERYGYDIDMVNLRGQTGTAKTVTQVATGNRFKGFSMGPGYYGKTFFVWPPDPRWGADSNTYGAVTGGSINPASPSTTLDARDNNGNWIADWRRRFFLRGDGVAFDPQVDNINTILFRNTAGHVLNNVTTTATNGVSNTAGYYRINYAAVIAWIKRGPVVMPTNLRQGRILYYSTIPDNVTESAAGNAADKRFWRQYIHYVLGVGEFDATDAPITTWSYTATQTMAGVESRNTYGPLSITTPTAFRPTGALADNRKPYMPHTDNINRPRAHFWFGPLSMFTFIERGGENRSWYSGTSHESQCWQVKAAINSVLDDVRNNHPNDQVGIAYFATRGHFNKPMAPMGQDWFTLKNVLFFRKDTVTALKANANSTIEHRPYNTTSLANDSEQIPNSSGSTDSNSGMAVAFNLLSSSTALNSTDYGSRGRRGAAKIVVFETDGIPNTTANWSLTGTGVDTRYQNSGSAESWGGDGSLNTAGRAAVAVVNRIVAPVTTSGVSGFSTPNAPARVYGVAFGDLFDDYNGSNFSSLSGNAQGALRFMLRVQQQGNTSGPGDPPVMIPFEQIITGPYQRPNPSLPEDAVSNPPGRIEKMRLAYERIMQSGIQVTLVQ
jgi:Flp pilus assembly protein TadG